MERQNQLFNSKYQDNTGLNLKQKNLNSSNFRYMNPDNSQYENIQKKKYFSSNLNQFHENTQQKNLLPSYNQQYTFLKKYKKLDQFLDMESYFHNLYGQKKQIRIAKQKENRENREKSILPSIYKTDKMREDMQKQLLNLKLKHLEERLNKVEPMNVTGLCGMFPPIYGGNYCQNCNSGQKNQVNGNQNQNNQTKVVRKFTEAERKRLRRKFRVAGYVIFFATIFPHYSLMFGHFKLKDFLEKYLLQGNKHIRLMNSVFIQKLKQIPLYQQIRQIHQNYETKVKQAGKSQQKKDEQPKIKISNEDSKENYIINLNIFKKIVAKILTIFQQLVDQFDQEMLDFLSIGALNTSYYGDEIYTIQEMPFVVCHPDKGNVLLTKEQEKALVLSKYFIKKIIFQYLVRLAVNEEWHEELASFSTLKKKDVTFFKLICKELELASFFLYELAIKHFYSLIESENVGNLLEQSDSSLPLPLKTMKFPSLFMTVQEKQIYNNGFDDFKTKKFVTQKTVNGNTNKTITQTTIKRYDSEYDFGKDQLEVFDQYQTLIQDDPLNLIHNNFQFLQLSKIISQYMTSSYDKAEKTILRIVDKLHGKLIDKRRSFYKKIHEKIMKKKFILTKQHQILQGVVFLRNNQQKREVTYCRKMLEIYLQSLNQYEVENQDRLESLQSKREIIKQKKAKKAGSQDLGKSAISIMSK